MSCGSTARSSSSPGAGRNLGREYALAVRVARRARARERPRRRHQRHRRRGRRADRSTRRRRWSPRSSPPAEKRSANRDTIATPEGGRAIVDAALDAFGTVDVVVNNAGQVRMAPFPELTEAQLDAVIDTQLRGALNVESARVGGDGRTGVAAAS